MSMNSAAKLAGAGPSQKQAMDRMYRLQRHVYDLTRRHYLIGREHLISHLDPPPGGTVLEIGCGTGRNLLKVAERHPACRVLGVDISEEMLKSAASAIARHGLTRRISIAEGDALSFDPKRAFGLPAFDRIYFSYTLSMIPNWPPALRHARSLLAPAGQLHIVDFGQCEDLTLWFRHMLFRWLRLFHVMPQALLKPELEALARSQGDELTYQRLHRGYSHYFRLTARPS